MIVTGLFDVYAILFGIFGGLVANAVNHQPVGPFFANLLTNASIPDLWGSFLKCTLFGAIIAVVCCYKGMTASGGAEGVGRAVNQAVVIADARRVRVQLRVHADAAGHPPRHPQHQVNDWLAVPRDWLASFGEILRFCGRVMGEVFGLKVFRYFGEALRQAGVLILSSHARHLGPDVHHRPAVRHRGRVLQPRHRRPRLRGRVRRLVRPARADPVRVRLHDVREGRHRDRGRARLDADLRRDRRARGHGHLLDDVPVRDPPAGRLARAAVRLPGRRSAPASWPPTWLWCSRSGRYRAAATR